MSEQNTKHIKRAELAKACVDNAQGRKASIAPTEQNGKQTKSIELAKASINNAQGGNGAVDSKVSIALSQQIAKQTKSIELVKAGFENAQSRIGAIDTKVSISVGLLSLMLPVPMVVAAWLTGLGGAAATHIFATCKGHPLPCVLLAVLLLTGMVFAFLAILRGVSCLSPRGPNGYCNPAPWRPNALFPLHHPDRKDEFCTHVNQLKPGVDLPFVLDEYEHQLVELGHILHEKITDMKACFRRLKCCLLCYGLSVFVAMTLALMAILHAATAAGP